MNTILIIGNLTREPELNAEKGYVKFGLADNTGHGESEEVNFYDVYVWGGAKDAIVKYKHKGDRVMVSGKLRVNMWTGDTGTKAFLKVMANEVSFLGASKKGADEATEKLKADKVVEVEVDSDDLPF